jgi:prepilin-type N-terminal cleavage/methylation domain-containing protein
MNAPTHIARCARTRPAGAREGFSLVELLLALTILALLISSIAVAFQASLRSCEENDRMASTTQTVRSILSRVTSQIRSAEAIDLDAGYSELVIVTPEGGAGQHEIRYALNPDAGTLVYQQRTGGIVTEDQVLLGDGQDCQVVGFSASIQVGKDWQGYTCAKSVTVRLNFNQAGRPVSVTASASPRRNQTY